MVKKVKKILIPALLILVIFPISIAFMESSDSDLDSVSSSNLTKAQENAAIKALNQEISSKKNLLDEVREQKKKYSEAIREAQKRQSSLANQLEILDNRIFEAELEIENVKIEIDQINLEIKKVKTEINNKNNQIEKEKDRMANILKMMHEQNKMTDFEVVLMNDNLSEFMNRIKYLEDTNKEMRKSLDNLKNLKKELEEKQESLQKQNNELAGLKNELESKKEDLEKRKSDKEFILQQTKKSEQRYQNLLTKAKSEQENASAEIASLEKEVRKKLQKVSKEKLQFNDEGLIWPVPKNKITAYFHDPDYPFRYLFEHPAIDIRAGQGTTLKAAASGYIARVKLDNTSSYGYIMIVHGDGMSTVYGHISKAYVNEDEYVVQGQVIGLTGGMPGTAGSGYLTTGPHLHFEVRKNGIPVDPLEYLP